ncbi:hypothetical protein LSCM1_01381 [Leishmania martiniquensis]|uniref:Fungal lipase-type domain-containing protein n=1 Tax=Leishmania martiniquensis TaxID=1580590 RepID=A0A836KCH6_9TRYP|nr:hypothetical protein LSCM1_01381 [Leishmania martiniquensis]
MHGLRPALRSLCVACVVLCVLLASVVVARRPFSYAEAWRAHFFSRATYCKSSDVRSWKCGPACSSVGAIEMKAVMSNFLPGTFGFVGADHVKGQIVVAYRGTNNVQNFLADLNLLQKNYDKSSTCGKRCKVHAGFYDSYKSLRQQTRDNVLRLIQDHPTYEILVTGHSLGGAMAVLAAADLQEHLNRLKCSSACKPVSLYTFGAPRVGNAAFAKWVDALLANGAKYRITHGLDPVVRVPALLCGYAHTTSEVFFRTRSNSSAVKCNDSPGREDSKCSLGMLSLWPDDHLYYMGETSGCK